MTDQKSKQKTKGADLSGLDDFSVSSLLGSGKKQATNAEADTDGSISYAPLSRFVEDAENARQEFNINKLQELAESMMQVNPTTGKPRGILEPLSCKHHPDDPEKLIVLGGNRRFRAAGMAGLDEAPYIIKDELDDFDKFVLNDQRENLTPLERAVFIKARIDEGHKPGKIAKALGRPPSYVSDHIIFFEMSDAIRDLYDRGLCRSMQALALLHRAHKKHPADVDGFCMDVSDEGLELTTSRVRVFVDSLKRPAKKEPTETESGTGTDGDGQADDQDSPQGGADGDEGGSPSPALTEGVSSSQGDAGEPSGENLEPTPKQEEEQQPLKVDGEPISGGTYEDQADAMLDQDTKGDRIKKAIIQVKHDEREARLLTDRRASYGLAWIKYDDDGHEIEADLNEVNLVAIIEA